MSEALCRVCGHSEEWHKENKPVHKFSVDGAGGLNQQAQPGPKVSVSRGLPSDPALRIALVNAGVIKYSDIIVAEEALKNAAENGKAIVLDDATREGPSLPNDGDSIKPST